MSQEKENLHKHAPFLYWVLPLILWLGYVLYTLNSMNQIRYEEIAESVRNVFWLQNHLVYDGVSSNIGWYGTLLLIYHMFGFSLSTAKIFHLMLQLVSLYSLAALLEKYLDKHAWLPLIAISLSPTILYFTTLQTPYGIDLQMLPICLLILLNINFLDSIAHVWQTVLLWALMMLTAMSYGIFLLYVPAVGFLYLYLLYKQVGIDIKSLAKNISLSIASFLGPLIIGILYVNNKSILLYDTRFDSGIFRGGGHLNLSQTHFMQNLSSIVRDFFIRGNSYNFELFKADFSDIYPILSVVAVIPVLIYASKKKKKSIFIPMALLIGTILLAYIVVSLTGDPAHTFGMRRNTPILASIYALYIFGWYIFQQIQDVKKNIKTILLVLFGLLLIHHILVFPSNLFHLTDTSHYAYTVGVLPGRSPSESLNLVTQQAQLRSIYLNCQNKDCRYQEFYSEVAGACTWNKLMCYPMYGYDYRTKKFKQLELSLWTTYYWEH